MSILETPHIDPLSFMLQVKKIKVSICTRQRRQKRLFHVVVVSFLKGGPFSGAPFHSSPLGLKWRVTTDDKLNGSLSFLD